jgi:endonuclease YncB( thermonuclease family)
MRSALALVLLALAASAAEPKEIFEAGAPATVRLTRSDGATVAGIVIDVDRGWILTSTTAVQGETVLSTRLKSGADRTAKVAARDTGVRLALLEAGKLAEGGAKAVTLAPAMKKSGEIAAARVYAIGHAKSPWTLGQGLVAHVRALPLEGLAGLVLVEHGAPGTDGGPLFDSEGRLIAIHLGRREDWSGLKDRYFAVPVNAIRSFLGRQGIDVPGGLPSGSLAVFDRSKIKAKLPPIEDPKPPTPTPESAPDVPDVEIPDGLRYGPYTHLIESKEKAALSRRVKKMLVGLYGLFRKCRTCNGKGVIKHLVREGFWLDRETWVPPEYETKTCHTCDGAGELFNDAKGASVFRSMTMAEKSDRGAYESAEQDWLERLMGSKRSYYRAPRFSLRVHGRYATVRGGRNNPLFPLHFKLLPKGRKYEWYLHVEELNGPFDRDRPAGSSGLVAEVAAADTLILEDGTIVRLCGICAPGPNGKVPPPDIRYPNEEPRKIVRDELRGRRVRLERDKYVQATCDGHPLVFVRLERDGKDYGAELLRRGIARRHPKHRHSRNVAYQKAESAARKAQVGIWKQ